ncbi:hypothetical protein TNCV_3662271 [Trichonephila clavipes]|nr:hypothetical protein TNCV_3662271 [Trichonephila clavipes]
MCRSYRASLSYSLKGSHNNGHHVDILRCSTCLSGYLCYKRAHFLKHDMDTRSCKTGLTTCRTPRVLVRLKAVEILQDVQCDPLEPIDSIFE